MPGRSQILSRLHLLFHQGLCISELFPINWPVPMRSTRMDPQRKHWREEPLDMTDRGAVTSRVASNRIATRSPTADRTTFEPRGGYKSRCTNQNSIVHSNVTTIAGGSRSRRSSRRVISSVPSKVIGHVLVQLFGSLGFAATTARTTSSTAFVSTFTSSTDTSSRLGNRLRLGLFSLGWSSSNLVGGANSNLAHSHREPTKKKKEERGRFS